MPRARVRALTVCVVALASLLTQGCADKDPKPTATPPPSVAFEIPAFIANAKTHKSWNPHVRCRAVVTTLRRVLGRDRGPSGGATFQGGGFKPGIPDRRALRPPCKVRKIPTFVQLNKVTVGSCSQINADGDWTCALTDPRLRGPMDMRRIHIETDQKFRHRSGWSRPPGGELIKIQGFVFWDPGHTGSAWHNHSGWEIHSFTAWKHVR
jgi:hypothetical protein